jgi:hypothetical protein
MLRMSRPIVPTLSQAFGTGWFSKQLRDALRDEAERFGAIEEPEARGRAVADLFAAW